ncbi:MAG: hypothetical protein KKF44_02485 [Nanoarchaeota archaeon]|nr:hypothetical protein [Nanoarchaeota archaeon]
MTWDEGWDEVQHVTLGQKISYSGIFNYKEFFRLLDRFFMVKGYEKRVLRDKENVYKTGKSIHARIRPFKEFKGKNARLEVQVWINITDMKNLVKEIDGKKVHMNQGNVDITIDSFVMTNRRGKWEQRAEYIFIRTIFDKFLMGNPTTDYDGMAAKDAADLINELSSFLNMNNFLF